MHNHTVPVVINAHNDKKKRKHPSLLTDAPSTFNLNYYGKSVFTLLYYNTTSSNSAKTFATLFQVYATTIL